MCSSSESMNCLNEIMGKDISYVKRDTRKIVCLEIELKFCNRSLSLNIKPSKQAWNKIKFFLRSISRVSSNHFSSSCAFKNTCQYARLNLLQEHLPICKA